MSNLKDPENLSLVHLQHCFLILLGLELVQSVIEPPSEKGNKVIRELEGFPKKRRLLLYYYFYNYLY